MLRHGTPSGHTSDRPNFEHVFSASFKFSGVISSVKSQEEGFLKVFLVGGCGASHGLNVKVTAAVAACFSIVVRMPVKVLLKCLLSFSADWCAEVFHNTNIFMAVSNKLRRYV
ncbi:hypothetical protein VCUG_02634 [Vavraia culicis subsp. floridensis]|uniref:Uncharacterized protein n=1 Tax=Vavraia culicis (isolate floridensis) TaxID=948595 RepID=L2GQJ7_VAVCU|nr:uncharacterized protein VCUG_02634 [Vavraia culicis subsp. floridensis]ELA45879.1 hypothetical protein VCUG_02634 [Vavraia culicis subsp. floridensis]